MKKKVFFLPLVAALALTGCSNDEPAANGNQTANGEGKYLAVSIVSTDSNGSRYTEGNLEYEDGTTVENAVKGLRVYFFDAYGQPVNVKNNSGNYYDVPTDEITTDGGDQTETVEKKINAVLIVNSGETVPSQLVAVLNPNTTVSGLGDGSYTLVDLRREIDNYAKLANESGQFVMTNSAYVDGGNIVEAQTILPDNYAKSAEEAKLNPVTIYVERNVAKVRVRASMTDKTSNTTGDGIMCPVYDKSTNQPYTIKDGTTETAVWVKFLGWDVTADLESAFLCKNIRTGWKSNILGAGNWNDPTHHRSYWADVCDGGTASATNTNQYFSYASGTNFKLTKFDGLESKYCNENGEKKGLSGTIYKNTEVIIKGELCDGEGKPLTFTEIAGIRVIDDNNFTNLKNTYLQMLKSGRAHSHWKVYRDATTGKITSAKEITADDITFMTANQSIERGIQGATRIETVENGSYYVYACLIDEVAAATDFEWYTNVTIEDETDAEGNVTGQTITVDEREKVTAADVNGHLLDLSHAKIWNSGKTYYFATIMHGTNNLAGVVRNHIYDMNLKSVYGIGTPVYDPDEVIVPEKPTDEDTYVAAEIKILSWRLVSQEVNLEWD